MVKSYPGFGPVFLILFFVIIGTWMFINPMLNDPTDYKLNYGGLFFTAIGMSLLFTLKTVTLWEKGIIVKYIITKKELKIPKNEIHQVTIVDDNRNFPEVYFSHGRKRGRFIKFEFKDNFAKTLSLLPLTSTGYNSMLSFIRANYSEIINEQTLTA